MPGIYAMNYVCAQSLDGGGSSSLRLDGQGKAYAQKLLSLPIEIPTAWMKEIRKDKGGKFVDDYMPKPRL